jgi:Rrf2 family protein
MMLVSTRGRYALRVMIDLAEHNSGDYITLRDIAQRQEISEKYLESIISILVKASFVEGMRGKGGGYRLTRPPEGYTVGSVLKMTEGTLAPVACLDGKAKNCGHSVDCKTLPMWEKLNTLIDEYLEGITIADLAAMGGSDYNFVI